MNNTRASINQKDFDPKVRPQDDFFHFAAGGWLKRNPIPRTEVRWGSFYLLRDENRKRIRKIFTSIKKGDSKSINETTRRLRDFYHSGLDERTIERLGMGALRGQLDRINAVADHDDLFSLDRDRTPLWTIGQSR
jgi:putative endopeptidase